MFSTLTLIALLIFVAFILLILGVFALVICMQLNGLRKSYFDLLGEINIYIANTVEFVNDYKIVVEGVRDRANETMNLLRNLEKIESSTLQVFIHKSKAAINEIEENRNNKNES